MDFNLNDEQTMLRDTAARVVGELCTLQRRRDRIARGGGIDLDLANQCAELGWSALCIPEGEGGLGGNMTDIALLMIELGRGMSIEPMMSGVLMSGRLLADAGWSGKTRWIDEVLSGTRRVTFANREGTDRLERPAPRQTIIKAKGNKLELAGTKRLIWDADTADGFLVTASTPDTRELVLVLIPRTRMGISVSPYMLIDGSRAGDLFLDRIEVAETDVVARGKDAVALIEGALSRAIVGALAAAVGSMEVCVDLCCEYLKTRWQFGQPLGKFQALQHMVAQMLLTAHNARSMLYHALSNFEAEPEVRHASLASAQRMISQSSLMVSRAGIQLHGAYGITDEYAISHHHRFHYMLEKRFGDAALIHAEQQLMGDEVPVGSRPTCI